jgi:hypothetical protein
MTAAMQAGPWYRSELATTRDVWKIAVPCGVVKHASAVMSGREVNQQHPRQDSAMENEGEAHGVTYQRGRMS